MGKAKAVSNIFIILFIIGALYTVYLITQGTSMDTLRVYIIGSVISGIIAGLLRAKGRL